MSFKEEQNASQLPPYRAIIFALFCSFFVFLFLDQIEQLIIDKNLVRIDLRLCHFVSGFLSTFAGMAIVWLIMARKEQELLKWRNHFATELEARSSELSSALDSRIEDMSRISAVLDSVAQGIIELNESGVVCNLNRTAIEILGLKDQELTGSTLDIFAERLKIIDGICEKPLFDSQALMLADSPREFRYYAPDGNVRILEWKAAPMRTSERNFGVVIAVSDLSERYRLQAKLLQQRDDFIAVIKHRLQINIFALKRVVKLILEHAFGELQNQQKETISVLAMTIEDTEMVLSMLAEIYMYKNRQKQLDIAELDLNALLKELSSELGKSFSKKTIILPETQETRTLLKGDQKALKKLLSHLLLNGLKFASREVQVKIFSAEEFIKLQVIDDGPGIHKEDLPDIFDRFFKESASGKHVPVTGLGLCLCSEIAQAHGGSIRCIRNKEETATTFEIQLPRSKG